MNIHDIVTCESDHDVFRIRQNYEGAETMTGQKKPTGGEEGKYQKRNRDSRKRTGERKNNLKNC